MTFTETGGRMVVARDPERVTVITVMLYVFCHNLKRVAWLRRWLGKPQLRLQVLPQVELN